MNSYLLAGLGLSLITTFFYKFRSDSLSSKNKALNESNKSLNSELSRAKRQLGEINNVQKELLNLSDPDIIKRLRQQGWYQDK